MVNILIVGCGGIGTIAALNLQSGGKARVTTVLRSNYDHVKQHGFHIRSLDHGVVESFRPDTIRNAVPNVSEENIEPYRYIVCTTKNIADVPPSLSDLIRPAVTPGYSVIVLIQNGLNIEKPILDAFPQNIVLSSVSFCGSHEVGTGQIVHEDHDRAFIGAFDNPNLDAQVQQEAATDFVEIYKAGGKCSPEYQPNVGWTRWRKLVYNACLNSICAVTDLDTGRMQLADGAIDNLVRPAMQEIRAAAEAYGHDLPEELVEAMIRMDPITMYNPPSMQVDLRKGRYCEFETIVGEPLRAGLARGVPMPLLTALYHILRAVQWKTKERNGFVTIPEPEDHSVKR
ncbi:ketopantoate reductase family protein [Aspergillus glaucus CBS 516.65]|uniref:2-dehydropantoate 2-reductase n=1 Tax=Aspergillus glaucus CBS 516.65 TaxID=1160497 RepID=A0A1L9V5I2_ASPGL|nr:hypothetical protein ASPGLDRAFT_159330 [Aspergillus glaucus CBS 516.65]OJJ79197.1 hypothetical protein ASPGLDRAFT_159330 [Aspergillus glaucus CBS 516.65]